MRRKKLLLVIPLLLTAWIVWAQTGMRFTMSDKKAKQEFAKDSLLLSTSTIAISNFNLHYTQTGDNEKPTIFFLHGSPGSWTAFKDYMKDKQLLERFRLISVDRPGFGQSEFGKALPLMKQAELIIELMDTLNNGKPFYIVGHSLAGPLQVILAAMRPSMVEGLVILAGSMDPEMEKPEKWRKLFINSPLQYFVPGALRPSNLELWYLKKDLVDILPLYKEITCKVLIVHGKKDELVPYANSTWLKAKLTNATSVELVSLEKAGHFLVWYEFGFIRDLLISFTT